MSLEQQAEWVSLFEKNKAKVVPVLARLTILEQEIDDQIYRAFGLDAQERMVIEQG
ncbi:MAG: hypothetical protein ACREHF_14830 [Rhizomicrobium sp.]